MKTPQPFYDVIPPVVPIEIATFAAGPDDAHGDPVDTWGPWVESLVYAVSPRSDVSSGASEPNMPNREMVIVGLTVYAPPWIAITPRDRVRIDGRVYTVEGEVGNWNRGFHGWQSGITFALKRVEG